MLITLSREIESVPKILVLGVTLALVNTWLDCVSRSKLLNSEVLVGRKVLQDTEVEGTRGPCKMLETWTRVPIFSFLLLLCLLKFKILRSYQRKVADDDGNGKRNVMANDQISGREADNTVASFSCQWL